MTMMTVTIEQLVQMTRKRILGQARTEKGAFDWLVAAGLRSDQARSIIDAARESLPRSTSGAHVRGASEKESCSVVASRPRGVNRA